MGHCEAKVMTARGVIEDIPLSKEETEQVRCRNVWPHPTFMGMPADGPGDIRKPILVTVMVLC